MITKVRQLVPPTQTRATPENVLARNSGAISDFLMRVEALVRESILRGQYERLSIEATVTPNGLDIAWMTAGETIKYN